MLPVRAGVAEIFRRAGAPFRERREGRIDAGRLKVMAAIEACRTAVLGGHMYRCDGCGREHPLHNSCRNRHCPTCQGLAANRWSEARAEDILPVPYFHVVFTLPREIAAIAFCNRRSVFDILFRTVAETLRTIAADPRHGGMRTLRRVFYTVPSRLIGHRLGVRLYDDRLELFLSGTRHLTLPRGRPSKTGTHVHVVNYRHVIHSLKRKPMALLNLVYRDALFPRDAYRRCFEAALERLTEREACRLAVTLLALAHEENCEAELAAEIDRVLDKGRLPAPNDLKARFAPDPGQMPRIDVARTHLAGYGSLLGAGGAS